MKDKKLYILIFFNKIMGEISANSPQTIFFSLTDFHLVKDGIF